MNFHLPKLLPVIAAVLPALQYWLVQQSAHDAETRHLPRFGEADRIPRPGAYALLAGYVPD